VDDARHYAEGEGEREISNLVIIILIVDFRSRKAPCEKTEIEILKVFHIPFKLSLVSLSALVTESALYLSQSSFSSRLL
jgi:hypothetical protein